MLSDRDPRSTAAHAVSASAADDPRPEPPVAPDLDACCGNGCDPCIFDLHDLATDQYRQALRAWMARQSVQAAGAPPAQSS